MTFDFHAMPLSAVGTTVPMKPKQFYQNLFAALHDILKDFENSEENYNTHSYSTTKTITESHYEKVDVHAVIKEQKHLSVNQCFKLLEIFGK
jgi:hypothetical protein